MSDTRPAQPAASNVAPNAAVMREQMLLSLLPFFLEAALGDTAQARAGAEAAIDGFNPANTQELLLAAQVIVYSMAGLDSVRRSMTDPALPPNTLLRLRGNANAMQRAAQTCTRTLHARQNPRHPTQGRTAEPDPVLTEQDLADAIERASVIMAAAARGATHRADIPHTDTLQSSASNRQARRKAKFEALRAARAGRHPQAAFAGA